MRYPGGKGASGVVQTIINQQPPHDVYIEAFLGGGAVMRAKRPARVNIGIDRDPSTIANFGAAGSCELVCASAMDWILQRSVNDEWTGAELVYCDPPYPLSVRRSKRPMYRYECDDDVAHARLLGCLVGLPCMVQVSGYDCPLYSHWLEGWRVIRYQAQTRHGLRTECLWMNYPEPEMLHDFRFLGGDYRERERIKRKARRWVERLKATPRLERLAIYAEMASSIAGFDGGTRPCAPDRLKSSRLAEFDGAGHRLSPDSAVSARGDRTSPVLEVLQ